MADIGIIGAGNIGGVLAKRLVGLGHTVKVANSRGASTLREFEEETGARAVTVEEAFTDISFVIVAIPFAGIHSLAGRLGKVPYRTPIVIDTGNYIPERDGAIPSIDEGVPEAEWVSRELGIPVVKAFNSITADSLARRAAPTGAKDRVALPIACDSAEAYDIVAQLADDLGFDPYNAGSLANSWRQQPGQPAYCVDASLAELPPLLARADREAGPSRRDKAMAIVGKLPPDFPSQVLVRVSRLSVGLDRFKLESWKAVADLAVSLLTQSRKAR
jgi:predicted dinucleotide-binding enzyme